MLSFFADEKEAQRFLAGERLSQKDVDPKLAKILVEEDERYEVLKNLREYYGDISEDVHPNLDSLLARTSDSLKASIGLAPIFGGFLSHRLGRIVIVILLKSVISALHVLSGVISEQTGKWNEDYEKVKKHTNELLNGLKESTTTAKQPNESE